MTTDGKRKLRLTTIVYWVLLLYIVAALAWWAYSLLQQNSQIHQLRKELLHTGEGNYQQQVESINNSQRRGVYKYIGEGGAFLLLICVGAVFIYRSVRRQLRLQQQQQNFVMAVTHELKTPLAVSRLNLETLQKHKLEEDKRTKLLQTALQETLRLDTLINNILLATQLEDHAYRLTKEELNFSAIVNEAGKAFTTRYTDRPLNVNVQGNVTIVGDERLLKLLLSNLLENANKYSPKGKGVSVQLTQTATQICLTVADEGPGIADEEKRAVFEKFYRVGNEAVRKTQGTGLGLYICRRIVKDHRGEILLKDNQPAGSKFIVQFDA